MLENVKRLKAIRFLYKVSLSAPNEEMYTVQVVDIYIYILCTRDKKEGRIMFVQN